MYTPEELRALNGYDARPARPVRKAIFSLRLWAPARQRLHSQRRQRRPGSRPRAACVGGLTVGCVNARSVGNKAATLCSAIADGQLDIIVITETWHERTESTALKRATPPGYAYLEAARPLPPGVRTDTVNLQQHGGLAFIHRQAVRFQKRMFDVDATTFEYLYGFASTPDSHFVLLGIYRPGSQTLSAAFFEELSAVFERLATYRCPVVICGDFNIHVDEIDDVHAVRLAQLLQCYGYVQHVSEPTHTAGHTLDLVIARPDSDIRDLRVGGLLSDHALIRFSLRVNKPVPEVHEATCRAWRRLSRDAFASDLAASTLCCDLDALDGLTVDDLVQQYNQVWTGLLDRHCPRVIVRRRTKPAAPWFDADCRAARRRARVAERRFRRSGSESDRRGWSEVLKKMRALYEHKSHKYWQTEIAASKGNSKRLWRALHGVLGDVSSDDSGVNTADDFATFFKGKVESVRASTMTTPSYDVPFKETPTLSEWTPVTTDEIENLIGSAPCKTCQLDPAPTWLVKEMCGLLSPFISQLFNKSLAAGCFPSAFKEAMVRPLLKKDGLDACQMKNYRPVSNLSFLSKLLERVVQRRLQAFLDSNDLMPSTQSAYRKFHSTETVVLKVYNDLLLAADDGQLSALCLLDLTAAFDTVDHDLLMLRLERQFGLRGVVLQWFHSYLSGRSYRVLHGDNLSTTVYVLCSVPQGSVLGPRLFIMYTADLADTVEQHGVNCHSFADDTQLYLRCRCDESMTAAKRLENCIMDVSHWSAANRLKLNADKNAALGRIATRTCISG